MKIPLNVKNILSQVIDWRHELHRHPELGYQEIWTSEFICKKLDISINELESYHELPKKFYWDYPNQERIFNLGAKVLKKLGLEKSIKR